MGVFFAICAGVFIVLSGIVSVFLIQTLLQLRQTAKAVEVLANSANREMERVHSVGDSAAGVVNLFTGSLGRAVSMGFSLANMFLKRRGGAAAASGSSEKAS